MDAGNHRLLLTSSSAYYTFLETTENYALQTQRKNQVCLTRPRVLASRVPRLRVPLPRVLRSRVPRSRVPRPRPTFSDSQYNRVQNYGKLITILQQIMQRVCSHFTRKIVAQFGAQSISTVFINTKVKMYFFFLYRNKF